MIRPRRRESLSARVSVSLPRNSYQHSSPCLPSPGCAFSFHTLGPVTGRVGLTTGEPHSPSSTFLHAAHLRQVRGPPQCHLVPGCTRHTTWMLSWRGAEVALGVSDDREAATVKQKPRPAETAPGITNKGPEDTLASLSPNTWLPGF